MAERDRSDLDLRAALRAYAEDAPTDVRPAELARRFALEHPRGRTLMPQWRPALLPRLAWVLLLVGLLLALGSGALLIGSRLARSVPAVLPPIGQTFVCPPGSTPDDPGPADLARPPQGRGAMAFDRRAGRLVAISGQPVQTWTFDVCTNTWSHMHPNRQPPGFEWAESVYDVDSDVTILVPYQEAVWAYDLQANAWTEKGAAPTGDPVFLAYDPVSGLVVAVERSDRKQMWTYEIETDTWTPINQANGPDSYGPVVYDTSADRLVMYAWGPDRAETWLLDIRAGTWSRSGTEAPVISRGWSFPEPPAIAYDEAAGRTVVFNGGQMASYDATADRWQTVADAETGASFPASLAYDAVNRRLVGRTDGANAIPGSAVGALDPTTGEWTELLEPSPIPDADLVADLAAVWSNPDDPGWVASLYAPDAVVHDRVENLTQTGLEQIGARIRYVNTQDFKVVVTSAPIRQGDFVAHFVKFGAGKAAFPGLVVYEIKDGMVVNQWMYSTP